MGVDELKDPISCVFYILIAKIFFFKLTNLSPNLKRGKLMGSQLGSNNSEEIELSHEKPGVTVNFINIHQKPVGQLILKNAACPNGICRFGSGTLISSDLFLTAAHCFKKGESCKCELSFDFWCAPGCLPISKSSVSFNFQNASPNSPPIQPIEREKIFSIRERVETDESLDYLILRLNGSPGNTYGYAKISPVDVRRNDKIFIIGHPNQSIKKVAVGRVKELNEKKIYYDVATKEGSSGSGIIDATSGNIVGIHVSNPNTSVYPNLKVGIKISALLRSSPTLRNLAGL